MIKVHADDFRIGEEKKKAINKVLDSGKISEREKRSGIDTSILEK